MFILLRQIRKDNKMKSTTSDKQMQKLENDIKGIIDFANRGCHAGHTRKAHKVIMEAPENITRYEPLIYGYVYFAGYVMGQRAEREKRRAPKKEAL